MKPADLIARVQAALPDAQVELTGADCSFELRVVSQRLAGQTQVARQRMLLGLFTPELTSGALHSLSILARTPQEL